MTSVFCISIYINLNTKKRGWKPTLFFALNGSETPILSFALSGSETPILSFALSGSETPILSFALNGSETPILSLCVLLDLKKNINFFQQLLLLALLLTNTLSSSFYRDKGTVPSIYTRNNTHHQFVILHFFDYVGTSIYTSTNIPFKTEELMSRYRMTPEQMLRVKQYLENETEISSFSRISMIETLKDLQAENIVSNRLSYTKFIEQLESEMITSVLIELPKGDVTRRYVLSDSPKLNPIEIALSLNPGSHVSHGSALNLHFFQETSSENIYITKEQSVKPDYSSPLNQERIDYAFSRKMRSTNQIATFSYKQKEYRVYLLNGKNSKNAGVKFIDTNLFSKGVVMATSLERTLIDCIVRPSYAGGYETIIKALNEAKKKNIYIDQKKIIELLKKINLKYPYQNPLGYYLKKTGHPYDEIKNEVNRDVTFYLDYEIKDKNKNEEFSLYVPSVKIDEQDEK